MFHFGQVNYQANEEFCTAFGVHLRRLREEQGLSIRELAAACDLEHSQIYRIETGRINTTISMVRTPAEGLGITHQELFDFPFPAKSHKQH